MRPGRIWLPLVVTSAMLSLTAAVPVGAAPMSVADQRSSPVDRTPTVVGAAAPLPTGSVELGSVPETARITVDVVLRPRNAAGLARLAAAASARGSAGRRPPLARGAFLREFGGDPSAIAGLRAAAGQAGLTVAPVADGLIMAVSGSAVRVERLLHTHLVGVRLADGSLGRHATAPSELPRFLAGEVSAVVGLDDLQPRRAVSLTFPRNPAGNAVRRAGTTEATAPISGDGGPGPRACEAAQSDASPAGVLTDDAVASLYGVDGLYASGADGHGQTIDAYELDPFAPGDVAAFDACYFGADAAAAMASRLHVLPVDGGQTTGAGAGEAALDIENLSALAPGATIDVYEAPNTEAGSVDEFSRIVADDNASVVSTSAGLCEAAMTSDEPGVQQIENLLFEQAAAQGQTVVAASGDDGSSDCGTDGRRPVRPTLSVDDPASQPYVLAVGGTSVSTGPAPLESAWGGGGRGGGGGLSRAWTSPGWQADSGVPGVADPTVLADAQHQSAQAFCPHPVADCREVPDVSAVADPAAGSVTVYYGGSWTYAGGTSSAAPLWAAMLTDTASTTACTGSDRSDGGLGFVPPLLYRVAADPATAATSFHDVTAGSNAVVAHAGGLYPATVGYDMATGLGTPMLTGPDGVPGLAAALCTAAVAPGPTVERVTPDSVPVAVAPGQQAPVVTVLGSGFESASGAPIVASITIGGFRIPTTVGHASAVSVQGPGVLTVRMPTGAALDPGGSGGGGAGTYQVVVTDRTGAASTPGPASAVHYVIGTASAPVPTVSAVGPTGGPPSGGDTVTVYGSGFLGTAAVDFGSVASPSFAVVSDDRLTATVPPESGATGCATRVDPVSDVCQTEVVIRTSGGSSAPAPILPPYQGTIAWDAFGGVVAPSGCGCEVAPAPTEYDYLAVPRITSVTALGGADGRQYVSASGGTPVVIRGTGFDLLGYQWTDIGPPGRSLSVDNRLVALSPTELTVTVPQAPAGATLPLVEDVSVQTLASANRKSLGSPAPPSNSGSIVYAPTPTVRAMRGGTGRSAGPTTGGTVLTLSGSGFAAARSVLIVDQVLGAPSLAEASTFVVRGSQLRLTTPAADVGRDDVLVCSATACSTADPSVDTFTYFAPGDPTVASGRRLAGPPSGGTTVILSGSNLGWVIGVRFGRSPAPSFANLPGTDDGGSPTGITVTAPAGTAGHSVPITVETLASAVDGTGYSQPSAAVQFTYRNH